MVEEPRFEQLIHVFLGIEIAVVECSERTKRILAELLNLAGADGGIG